MAEPQYMDISYAMSRASHEIVMSPGWRKSAAAKAEYYYARQIDLKIVMRL
ncbi:DUF4406 domain-containing protein [Shewanella mangrovisoli]|uniref:DUF4406 domain-containing protein n=1 Tax=Shewanella mangrovisoli TaxID=2864211 RepID=UPI0024BDD7F1|nr:DUF4406 domain-containing protein [Shewanella sp. 10B]